MTLKRRTGLGFTLSVDPTGASTFTVLGNVVNGWKGPTSKAKMIETTILADLFDQFAKGQIDGGQITLSLAFDPDDTTAPLLGGLLRQQDPAPSWKIDYPNSTNDQTFAAHLEEMGATTERDKFHVVDVTLKVTGDPGYIHT